MIILPATGTSVLCLGLEYFQDRGQWPLRIRDTIVILWQLLLEVPHQWLFSRMFGKKKKTGSD